MNRSWTHLATLTIKIGHLIKLDCFTLSNDNKALFARVCLNINITKPCPRSITMISEYESIEFFLSYEGVHEVFPLCGINDHTLARCPNKLAPYLELVVVK